MLRDLKSHLKSRQSIPPAAARTASTTGSEVKINDDSAVCAEIIVGTVTDGIFTPKLQHRDGSDAWEDVPSDQLEGSFAAIASNVNQLVGYKGIKEGLRVVLTQSASPAPSTGAAFAANILSRPDVRPAP